MQAKIIIKDEVNFKLEGVSPSVRQKLVNKFKYDVPGARYLPAVRLGRWDGKVSFFSLGGSSYINLLPDVISILEAENYDIVLEDLREYQTSFDLQPVMEDTFSGRQWPPGHPNAGTPIMFRDYQVDVLNRFMSNQQCVQEIATGAGKTIITAALSLSVEPWGRSIIIVPNKDLVKQTEADYINLGLNVGVYFGERKEYNRKHTICTWQSLNNILKGTVAAGNDITMADFIKDVVCIMVDEVHAAKSDVLKTLLTSTFAHVPIRWGLTGTVPKEDHAKTSIVCSIGPVVGRLAAADLQEMGHLANCHVNIVQLLDNVEYKEYQQELKYLTETPARIAYIAQLIEKIKEGGNTLILVDRIATGKLLQVELSSLTSLLGDRPDVVFVNGGTKSKARKEEYDDFATATNKIFIATYGVAAVGLNIPRIFNLVLFEPGKSFVRVIQSIGRGIRKAQDKDSVQIWDLTSNCKFSKRHLSARKKFYTDAQYPYSMERVKWQ